MSLLKKKVLVVGLGKTGLSVSRWLTNQGAEVTVSEIKKKTDIDSDLINEISKVGVTLETGGHTMETFLNSDMIVVSPGVPLDLDPIVSSREKGIPVFGEMEMAAGLIDVPLIAITGTNGKSTTTSLVGSMIENAGHSVFVGGNIGTPLIDYVTGGRKAQFAVVEVSSFQLDTMEKFCPTVSILLNISPDHLDRYPNYEAYVQSKLKIFQNQGPGQHAILNDEDEVLSQLDLARGISVLRYGMEKKKNRHAFIEGKKLKAFLPGMKPREFDIEPYRLPGKHNLENLMAVVLAGLALKIKPTVIQNTIEHFTSLSHRLEFVRRIKGIAFYNDSKATNVNAALSSIKSFDQPVILIAGGRHKGGDYSPLVNAAKGRVRKAVLMGEAKKILAKAFKDLIPYMLVDSMTDAVTQAFSSAKKNDVVLLAPACSSFDMFSDYKHRGTVFKEAVEELGNGD